MRRPKRQIPFAIALAGLAPFTLTWTEGRCIACRTAVELGHIQFLSRLEAWAVGFNFGTRGPGNSIVVHTTDAGRTWREIFESAQDGGDSTGPPAFSFLDGGRGWISAALAAEDPLTSTTLDGGKNWIGISPRQLRSVRFFDEARGYAVNAATFLRTGDGGLHWAEFDIPHLRLIDRMFFLTPDVGWLAGTDGKSVFVFRTTDGGRSWQESRVVPPPGPESVHDLFFSDGTHGWFISWHDSERGTQVFATSDGGKTWTHAAEPAFQGRARWATTVRFLSAKEGYLFEKADSGGRDMFYTLDGGAHWTKQSLPQSVNDCQVFDGDLLCSAGENPDGFGTLTLHRD